MNSDSPRDGAPAPVPAAEHLDELLELLWEMRREREGSVNAFYEMAGRAFKLADLLAAALPHAPTCELCRNDGVTQPRPADVCGWHYQRLAQRLADEEAAHAPSPPTGWQPEKDEQ